MVKQHVLSDVILRAEFWHKNSHINFNERQRKVLNRFGWFTEDMESLPIIMYLTYYDMNNNPINIENVLRANIMKQIILSLMKG